MLRFFLNTIGRFLFGIVWTFVLILLAIIIACILLVAFLAGFALVWSGINGILWAISHDPRVGHQAVAFLVIGAVGMGVVVTIQGAIWDLFRAVRGRLA